MSKNKRSNEDAAPANYKETLHDLRVELVKLQSHVIRKRLRMLVILEGRDGAGKDGAIKRIVKHLSPRDTRVVALGRPSDHDEATWYFQRYVRHLPACGEIVLFNRSWYNRAGVETVMGFCTPEERESFMEDAPRFEHLLAHSGTLLRKYYLDIGKAEQERRLADRASNPLKQWKSSPIDAVAVEKWDAYSAARNSMFARTHTAAAPWEIIRTDDKRVARISVMKSILRSVDYKGKDEHRLIPEPSVVFAYDREHAPDERLAV